MIETLLTQLRKRKTSYLTKTILGEELLLKGLPTEAYEEVEADIEAAKSLIDQNNRIIEVLEGIQHEKVFH